MNTKIILIYINQIIKIMKIKNLLKLITILFSILCLSASSKDYYSINDGNWTVASNWSATSGGPPSTTYPDKGDAAYIESNNIILDVDFIGNDALTSLFVTGDGSLYGPNYSIDFKNNCEFTSTGDINIYSISIGSASPSSCYIYSTSTLTLNTFNINSSMGAITIDGIANISNLLNNNGVIDGTGTVNAEVYTGTGTVFGVTTNTIPTGSTVSSSTWIFDGSGTSDWNTASNWASGSVPTVDNAVSIIYSSSYIPPIISGTATCKSISINSNASLTIAPDGEITIDDYINNDGGVLTIQSDNTGTGSLIYTSGTPTATVERYITDNSWHSITPSTSGVIANDFYFNNNPSSWLTYHTESTNEWTFIIELSTVLPMGQGYMLWLDNTTKSNEISTMTGNLQSTDLSVTLEYSGSDLGWNFVGNPFSSAIDKDLGTWGNNITGAVYVWVNSDNDYRYYTSGSGGTLTDGIIPISQGFFVQATSSGSFTIPSDARVHSNQSFYKNKKNKTFC